MINHIDAMLGIHADRMERLQADVTRGQMLKARQDALPLLALGILGGANGHNRRDGQAAWRQIEMRPRRRVEFEPA